MPLLPGPIVEPLGDGFMLVVPDGLAPAFCAAPALPGALLMPTVPVEEPAVLVPGDVDMPEPVALPVAPPVLVVCAIASVLVRARAVASANVVFLINYSLSR